MCGIAGALDLTGRREFPRDRLAAMTDAIAHRGPDDEHVHVEPGLALGARRLSIIDLAGGRQPIGNEDGSIWVAFNGELFEYPELRRDLLDRGHRLATRCDTEAWVHLYEDHREGMFERARGQFAVSLWDRPSRTLILGRDRVGICPLHYAERDGWLLWASEIKSLLASGMVDAVPDPRGIDHLFTFFCTGTTRTFFQGVKSLPPGHFLRVRDGRIEIHRYWDLDFPDAGDEVRMADPTPLVDELEVHLERSVERRLRGDVPVVSYISGGLDSTVVLGLCSRRRGGAIPSFTIGLHKAGPDERSAAAEAAEVLGSRLTTVMMDKSRLAEAFPELIVAAEGPVLDTSCAALMRLAGAVHDQGYKVALTGEGGRRGARRLCLVQVSEDTRLDRRSDRELAAQPGASGAARGDRRRHARAPAAGFGHERRPPRPAGHVRAALAGPCPALQRGHVGPPRRPHAVQRSRPDQRPHHALAPVEPVAVRGLQGDAGRVADGLEGGTGSPCTTRSRPATRSSTTT